MWKIKIIHSDWNSGNWIHISACTDFKITAVSKACKIYITAVFIGILMCNEIWWVIMIWCTPAIFINDTSSVKHGICLQEFATPSTVCVNKSIWLYRRKWKFGTEYSFKNDIIIARIFKCDIPFDYIIFIINFIIKNYLKRIVIILKNNFENIFFKNKWVIMHTDFTAAIRKFSLNITFAIHSWAKRCNFLPNFILYGIIWIFTVYMGKFIIAVITFIAPMNMAVISLFINSENIMCVFGFKNKYIVFFVMFYHFVFLTWFI